MRWLVILVLAAASSAVLAQQQSSGDDNSNRRSEGFRGQGPGFYRGPGGPRFFQAPDEDEKARILKFWKEVSPRRFEAFNKLSQDRQGPLWNIIWRRFRTLEFIKASDPQMYDLRVKRVKLEDEVFGLTRDLRNAPGEKEAEIRQKLREKIGELVDLGADEHQAKIDRWQKMIDEEKRTMLAEKQDRENIIRKHMKAAERESGNLGDETATTQESGENAATQSSADAPAGQQ